MQGTLIPTPVIVGMGFVENAIRRRCRARRVMRGEIAMDRRMVFGFFSPARLAGAVADESEKANTLGVAESWLGHRR
jgi:hypothetical protein